MKSKILTLIAGISIFTAAGAGAATLTYSASPTIGSTNTTFSFLKFDTGLGTLTAVDLLFNSSVAGGSVSIDTNSSGEDATFTNLSAFIRTSGTGLTQQNTTPVNLSLSPGLPTVVPADSTQSFSITGSQSLISSVQTYTINSANWSSYQDVGGVANTPNFTGRAMTSFSITSAVQPTTSNSLFTAASSYTLRYTYTPSGPVPVPEPGQVAASLLLLGGIGAYVFIKRRKKSASAAA